MLIDCRDLSRRRVPLPADASVVVLDTGTRRRLAVSAYAERQTSCGAAAALGLDARRDTTVDALDALSTELLPRARHVVTENRRTLDAAEAAAAGDAMRLGGLMSASHASLRDDYAVSGPASMRSSNARQRIRGASALG